MNPRQITDLQRENQELRTMIARLKAELTKALQAVADAEGRRLIETRQPHVPSKVEFLGL